MYRCTPVWELPGPLPCSFSLHAVVLAGSGSRGVGVAGGLLLARTLCVVCAVSLEPLEL